jgi:hypothetical protein
MLIRASLAWVGALHCGRELELGGHVWGAGVGRGLRDLDAGGAAGVV